MKKITKEKSPNALKWHQTKNQTDHVIHQ